MEGKSGRAVKRIRLVEEQKERMAWKLEGKSGKREPKKKVGQGSKVMTWSPRKAVGKAIVALEGLPFSSVDGLDGFDGMGCFCQERQGALTR